MNPDDATMWNSILIYTASCSVVFGLGRGFMLAGILSYCSIVSNHRLAGKNFGFIISFWSLHDFVT